MRLQGLQPGASFQWWGSSNWQTANGLAWLQLSRDQISMSPALAQASGTELSGKAL